MLQQAAADHTAERRERYILGARDALFRALSLAQTDERHALTMALIRELNALIEFTGYCNSLRQSCRELGADIREAPELTI